MESPPSNVPVWRYVLETHGFGAFVALLLLYALYTYAPSVLRANEILAAHAMRDANREALLTVVCLNTAKTKELESLCWKALTDGKLEPR